MVKVVIQCRTTSTRLPGKVLLPLRDIPTAILCAKRAANRGLSVTVATSTDPTDDALASLLERAGIDVVRGPLESVLNRFILATQSLPEDGIVIRLTGDNVFPDGKFLEVLLDNFRQRNFEYLCTQSEHSRLPYGMSAEAFSIRALRRAAKESTEPYDHEHVTPWIKRNYGNAHLDLAAPGKDLDLSRLRCTIDHLTDYLNINRVFENIPDPLSSGWDELCLRLAQLESNRSVSPGISQMALGTVQLGMTYGAANRTGKPSAADAAALLTEAYASGVTCFDTARAYGESESVIGNELAKHRLGGAEIITKLAPFAESHSPQADVESVNASVFRSCRELGLRTLPVLLLHRWAHRHSSEGAIWNRLCELRAEGVIGKLGVSVQNPEEMKAALRDPAIEHIQFPINVLDWRWKKSGIDRLCVENPAKTIHARSIFLQGILISDAKTWPKVTGLNSMDWLKKLATSAQELRRESIADLCIAYVRSLKWIHRLVIGAETLPQFRENARLFSLPALTADEGVWLEEKLSGAPETLLNPALWPVAAKTQLTPKVAQT